MDELLKIKEEALLKIDTCQDLKTLNDLRVFYLGKNVILSQSGRPFLQQCDRRVSPALTRQH